MDRLRELSEILPAPDGQVLVRRRHLASPASRWSTASPWSRCRSATAWTINLFGLARMALPRPGAAIVSIELALLAHFSTREGVFLIQAQLTDNSWLLYEDVRLTGGFAFALWWKGPLAGQFVLTMGGYHPDFQVRDGYPDVPRLGSGVAGQRRHRHQGRVVLRAHVRGADGRARRRGEPRLRLGVGQGRVRRPRHRVLRPVLVRGDGLRPDLRRPAHRPRLVRRDQHQHHHRRPDQGLGARLRRPRGVRDRSVHDPRRVRQPGRRAGDHAGLGRLRRQVPRGRRGRCPGVQRDHRPWHPADLDGPAGRGHRRPTARPRCRSASSPSSRCSSPRRCRQPTSPPAAHRSPCRSS